MALSTQPAGTTMLSKESDIELRSRQLEGSPQLELPTQDAEQAPPLPLLKLLGSGFSFFVAGANDGSIGALLPYILSSYHIGTSLISLLYQALSPNPTLTIPTVTNPLPATSVPSWAGYSAL